MGHLNSSGRNNRQSGKPEDDFKGKLIDARNPVTRAVVALLFIQ